MEQSDNTGLTKSRYLSLDNLENYKRVFQISPEAIAVLTPEGIILDINRKVYDWLGYKSEEIIGTNIFEAKFITDKTKNLIKKNFMLRMQGQEILPYETDFIAKSGKILIGRITATIIINEKNETIGEIVMISDVTDKAKAEETLRKSEKKLSEQNIVLREKNIRLTELARELKIEKGRIEEYMRVNIDRLILPLLSKMKKKAEKDCKIYVALLEENLRSLTEPFGKRISVELKLAKKEIEICNMIRKKIPTREIAKLLNISERTVEVQRYNIRKKLGIVNKKVNLANYIRSLQ